MDERRTDGVIAWALMAPALVVLGVFGIFPIFYAFFVSLHRWRIKKADFLGFNHYLRALGNPYDLLGLLIGLGLVWIGTRWLSRRSRLRIASGSVVFLGGAWLALHCLLAMAGGGDGRLFNAFKVTLFYSLGTIPLEVVGSLLLATLLFKIATARSFFRVLFFLPYITPMIATAVVFRTIFSPNPSSLANRFWALVGSEPQRWLYDSRSIVALALQGIGVDAYPDWVNTLFPSLSLVCVLLYNIWVYIGYDTVILLAGLSAIPRHYFEAAAIDGANTWQSFRHVTLPLISPTLFFISLVAVIGTFKAFNHIYILRTAGAQDTVDVVSILIFDQIYQFHNAGYASALALILFVTILVLTVLQNRLLGRRVFYGD
ncbi:MAG: sugar ABC transporter permease [Candidatus Latescibacteria bacterium]|nr:sugar ABC transporter permease [Candidatus Latescibacterota bacterium]